MRHVTTCLLALGALLVPLAAAQARGSADVKNYLKKAIQAASAEDTAALPAALGEAVLKPLPEERRKEVLARLRAALQGAKVDKVELEEGAALAELSRTGRVKDRSQVLLTNEGGAWRLSSPYVYEIESPGLDARRGKKPVHVKLRTRTENRGYGDSSYSFRYATGDPSSCKNRVDVWVCHCKSFHTRRDGRMVDVGKKKLSAVKKVPSGAAWDRKVTIEKGHAYVVHCRDDRDRDFFVKLRVTSFESDAVEFDWTLLTGGFGAPADIHVPEVPNDRMGADGSDGICVR